MLLNGVISTNKGAKFMTLDIKDFYLNLNTPLAKQEYLREDEDI